MSTVAMIQKGWILIFLLSTWNTCLFSDQAKHSLHFWMGCQVLIPCQPHRTSSDSFKWFYKEDGGSKEIQLYFQDKRGLSHFAQRRGVLSILHDRSLVIDNLMERDQGIYWCENCFKDNCERETSDIFSVRKEILKEIQETIYITAGSSLTRTCSGEFHELRWTFEAGNKNAQKSELRPGTDMGTMNMSMHITPVKSTDAGKYTCWASKCGGPSQKLLTINLCVIQVNDSEDSSISCSVTCDVDLNNLKNSSTILINNTIISVDVEPSGSLICKASKIFDRHTTVTSKYMTSAVLNSTMGGSERTDYLFPVIVGVSVATACLIVMALLIFCLKSRLHAVFPFHPSCCGFSNKEEEEFFTVIYSSFVIKTPAEKRKKHSAEGDCIYSEIKCVEEITPLRRTLNGTVGDKFSTLSLDLYPQQ